MRLAFISDIHIDLLTSEEELISAFIETRRNQHIDVLVIAGDISENVDITIDFINRLNEVLSCKVYYVPGNHDLWNKHNQLNTLDIYKRFQAHDLCLVNQVIVLNEEWCLFGDVFWYDYSLADKKHPEDLLRLKHYDDRTWQDFYFVNWDKNDDDQCQDMIDLMQEKVNGYKDKKKILVSHMINHLNFTVPESMGEKWSFFNGFLGSQSLQKFVLDNQFNLAVCGHVHFRNAFRDRETLFICPCLGYEKEWPLFQKSGISLREQLEDALYCFDI